MTPSTIPSQPDVTAELRSLRKQVRWLQAGLLGVAAMGVMATAAVSPDVQGVIRAKGLVIVDDQGRDRILLGAPAPLSPGRRQDITTSMVFRAPDGKDRLILGEAPNPIIDGKVYPRVGASWGALLFNKDGEERGGLANLDNGRTLVSLDRAKGDAVTLFVNEASGFAGLTMNYDTGRIGDYAEALRFGTKGNAAYVQATNRDGSPAGALVGGAGGRPRLAEKAE